MTDLITIEATVEQNQITIGELQALAANLQQKGVRAALRAAAKPLQAAMRSAAPDDPRTSGSRLSQAINITQAKTGTRVRTGAGDRVADVGESELGVVVGPNKKVGGENVGYIGWMLEAGTKAHKISAKNNILKLGPRFIRGDVAHPGIRARNWMSGAFAAASSLVEQQFYAGLESWLDRNGR
ncbi:MAG TPA: HK97 gp10 family phage protein [Denitromonas sp.]|nr:HK97 gp10 family phage protein [Denitromonas sp.]